MQAGFCQYPGPEAKKKNQVFKGFLKVKNRVFQTKVVGTSRTREQIVATVYSYQFLNLSFYYAHFKVQAPLRQIIGLEALKSHI